jgi:hypothetical protein
MNMFEYSWLMRFQLGLGWGNLSSLSFLFQVLVAFGVRWDFCAKI